LKFFFKDRPLLKTFTFRPARSFSEILYSPLCEIRVANEGRLSSLITLLRIAYREYLYNIIFMYARLHYVHSYSIRNTRIMVITILTILKIKQFYVRCLIQKLRFFRVNSTVSSCKCDGP
jgi:hypothetical protein